MNVYLAGAIELIDLEQARQWRNEAKLLFEMHTNARAVSPLDYEPEEGPYNDEQIVNTDKALLARCQAVLVDGRQPGWGTAMEVLLANQQNIPVVVWGLDRERASIWLRHHATLFVPSLAEGVIEAAGLDV